MNEEERSEYLKKRTEINPAIFRVWEVMKKNGQLDGLSDDEVLLKVLDGTEKVLEHLENETKEGFIVGEKGFSFSTSTNAPIKKKK